jgi:hypothetical protein
MADGGIVTLLKTQAGVATQTRNAGTMRSGGTDCRAVAQVANPCYTTSRALFDAIAQISRFPMVDAVPIKT